MRRSPRPLPFLLLAALVVLAPAFVVCDEAGGTERVEFLVGGCGGAAPLTCRPESHVERDQGASGCCFGACVEDRPLVDLGDRSGASKTRTETPASAPPPPDAPPTRPAVTAPRRPWTTESERPPVSSLLGSVVLLL